MNRHIDYEEEYHGNDKKASRKERRIASNTDRSKFKKTDLKKAQTTKANTSDSRGRVLSITGEGILVSCKDQTYICSIRGHLKKERTRNKNILAVGDFVYFQILNDEQGQILDVEDRKSILERVDVSGRKRQLLAANIDQVFITTSLVKPPLKPFLIDRYIIAARKGNMEPIIIVNKIDLLKGKGSRSKEVLEQKRLYKSFLRAYKHMKIPIIAVSYETNENMGLLKKMMINKASVFSGQSGVGKSSLINLMLDLNLPVKKIIERTRKGAHTTTAAKLIPLKNGGFCIDTPGIKSFGLWDVKKEDIVSHFIEIQEQSKDCKFQNCKHIHEPGCAVLLAVKEGKIDPLLYESYAILIEGGTDEFTYY